MNTENIYSVYGHYNLTNGKWYIGMTSKEPKKRWHSGWGYSKSHIWSDIKESDWNTDWIHTVFDTFNNREDALDFEAFMIDIFDTIDNGYNLSNYSSYGFTDERRNKMSNALKGNHNHPIKKVIQFSKDGEFIAEYPSAHEAERQTGCNNSDIIRCCKCKRKTCGGYIWRYKEG